jgi:hypothetical protein
VKVWVNSDLSKNYPESEGVTSDSKDEGNMVDDLLNIVWENTDEESEPQSFRYFWVDLGNFSQGKRAKNASDSTRPKSSSTNTPSTSLLIKNRFLPNSIKVQLNFTNDRRVGLPIKPGT